MIRQTLTILSLLAITSGIAQAMPTATQCMPGVNCKLPDCRCWNDQKAPGGFDQKDIPQMVIVTYRGGITYTNLWNNIRALLNLSNPNKCSPRATYFIDDSFTNFENVAQLYRAGFEVGLSNSKTFNTELEWQNALKQVKQKMINNTVTASDITGGRSKDLMFGGKMQLNATKSNGLKYDSTCISQRLGMSNYQWPFTYDFAQDAKGCSPGIDTKGLEGFWQIPVTNFELNGKDCSQLSNCSTLFKTADDVFVFLANRFLVNYEQPYRPPVVLATDSEWLSDWADVTHRFLDAILSKPDVWVVSAQQALDWIRSPVKASEAGKIPSWNC